MQHGPNHKRIKKLKLKKKKGTIHTIETKMNNKLGDTEESVSELKNRMEIFQSEMQKEKQIKKKNNLRDLCNNFKHMNIHIIGVTV